jgi:hypothetical protein
MHLKHPVSSNAEQEFTYGHQRFDMLGPVAPYCPQMESYGNGDEEKRACDLKRLSSQVPDCVIISIGSANMWNFEEEIHDKLPHCRIETFDCTISASTLPPEPIRDRTTFHPVCIGAEDATTGDGRIFKSWRSILQSINATMAPLYLKMDIEGYEYGVLRNIIDDGTLLPMQIAFELHYITQMGLPWSGRHKSSAEIATFMEYLHHKGEYFMIDRHDNVLCPHCSEILISRIACTC